MNQETADRLEAARKRLLATERRQTLIQLIRDAKINIRQGQRVNAERKLDEVLRLLGN